MNIEPKLETRTPQPYAALRVEAPLPFGPMLGSWWGEVGTWLGSQGVEITGPALIRYLTTDMESGKLDLEVGFTIAAVVPGNGRITTGLLPGGRYATYLYYGHYDNLVAVTGAFLEALEKQKISVKKTMVGDTEWWASRVEAYPTDPDTTPDPKDWQTELAFLTVED